MIWIISGPSSSGKSTFIESLRAREITGLSRKPAVFLASEEIPKAHELYYNCFIHYNILRPCRVIPQLKINDPTRAVKLVEEPFIKSIDNFFPTFKTNSWKHIKGSWNYKIDMKWSDICNIDLPKKAIVLVTSLETLLIRAQKRTEIEKKSISSEEYQTYPSKYWMNIFEKVNLFDIYKKWLRELYEQKIEFIIVDSTSTAYETYDNFDDLQYLLHQSKK
jgi:hypothetical protein